MKRNRMISILIFLLIAGGICCIFLGFRERADLLSYGIGGMLAGACLQYVKLSRSYVWICKECYLRFEVPAANFLMAPLAGESHKKLYCPKCKKKTKCRGKKIAIYSHEF